MSVDVQGQAPGSPEAGTGASEREWRWRRVHQFMDERGLDGLLVFSYDQGRFGAEHYLANDRRFQHLVVPRHGQMTMVAFGAQVAAQSFLSAERGEDTWIEDIRVGRTPLIISLLREKGLERGRVGVIGLGYAFPFMPNGWIPYKTWAEIKEALPRTDFVDVGFDFALLMLERSERDIASLRRAAQAGDAACEAMMEVARDGATETEVYAAAMRAMHERGMRVPWMLFQTGPDNFAWGEPMWTLRPQPPRRLQEGDLVMAEMFPNYGEMWAQTNVSFGIGQLHPDIDRLATVARKSYEAGLQTLKGGARFVEVADAMEQPFRDSGLWHATPVICTLNPLLVAGPAGEGIEKHVPGFAERYPYVHADEPVLQDIEIRPGMTFSFQPGARLGRRVAICGGVIVATSTGCEELSRMSPHFRRVPAR